MSDDLKNLIEWRLYAREVREALGHKLSDEELQIALQHFRAGKESKEAVDSLKSDHPVTTNYGAW